MDEYLDVKIDVFENAGQRARIRKSLTVTDLIQEILKEFDDIPADAPEKYAVYLKGDDRPLKSGETVLTLDLQPQDELVFDYVRQTIRRMFNPQQVVYLREEATGKVFNLEWQPGVIGRPTNEADHNLTLAVNVQALSTGMTISRRHAQITLAEGRYFVEALAENNPTFVNGKEILVNARRELKNGDKLVLGRNNVTFTFLTQKPSESSLRAAQPVASQPRSTPAAQPPAPQAAPPVREERTYLAAAPVLIVEQASQPGNVGQRLDLINFPFVLGRDLPQLLGEVDVSRRHAEVNFDPATQKFTITDLKSTNGVLVENVFIEPNQPVEVRRGSRIWLGQKVVLRLEF